MREFARLLAPITRRIRLIAARAVVAVISDAVKMQVLQVNLLDGEVRDGIERFQNYGFTSHPLPGAEGVYLSIGGDRDHGVVICVDDRRYRLHPLAQGEIAIYDDQRQAVHIKRDGIAIDGQNIILRTPGVLRLDGAAIEIHADVYLQQDVHGKGQRETHAGGTVYNLDTYTTGATGSSTEHGLSQPAVPGTHPEGP